MGRHMQGTVGWQTEFQLHSLFILHSFVQQIFTEHLLCASPSLGSDNIAMKSAANKNPGYVRGVVILVETGGGR